tara:strand:- start:1849 stop:2667 length:819 start_codon:yes stop_codon:yes gene_type:complete
MKMKHNKRRNTSFIYEVIIRELTKAMLNKDSKKKSAIIKLIRETFRGNTLLAKDLDLYKAILDTKDIDKYTAEKIIFQARTQKMSINHKKLFREQTEIINKINKEISADVFSNFVPNYKDLATVFQIFHPKTKTSNRVLLESQMISRMISEVEAEKELMKPIDNFTYRTFVKKFNEKYSSSLLSEQKDLLSKYVTSFSDNGIELKMFLSEEIPRLFLKVSESIESKEIKSDKNMLEKTSQVIEILKKTSKRPVDNKFVHEILKIQNLVQELK